MAGLFFWVTFIFLSGVICGACGAINHEIKRTTANEDKL